MSHLKDIRDLLIEQLEELIFSNRLVDGVLPEIQLKVTSQSNGKILGKLWDNNEFQWNRLIQVFQMLNENLRSEDCPFMSSMATIHQNLADLAIDSEQVDNNLLSYLIRMEQFQMAGYGAVAVYADTLGFCKVAELMKSSLMEKKDMSKRIESKLDDLTVW